MVERLFDHLTIDGDEVKLDGAVIKNLDHNEDFSGLKEDFTAMVNSAYVTDSASGSVAHFGDGADDVPMKSAKVNIASVQSGSGDPSPSNVRAISGWDSVKVTRAGKNLLPKYVINPPLYNGVTFTVNSDGSVRTNGTASATCNASSAYITGIDGEVVLSGCPSDGSATTYQIWIYDKTANASTAIIDTGDGSTGTLIKSHVYSVRIRIQSGYTIDKTFYPMLRLSSDSDTYEPYNGDTYTVSLSSAGTVYGGTLDVVSGVLTVDKKMVTIDGSNYGLGVLSNIYNNRYCYRNTYLGGIIEKNLPSEITKACCNMLKSISRSGATLASNGIFQYHGDNDELRFLFPLEDAYSTPDKIYALGLECCIPLATPLTYQLSAQEIKSLLGINSIWSDAGDMDVEYRADTKLYIDKRLAEVTA